MQLRLIYLLWIIGIILPSYSSAGVRIKDIVDVEGIRENQLVGYGLVVGLNGTGDNLSNANFTQKGLTDFLGKMGVNMKGASMKTKNVAAVTVTATLPAFAHHGSKLDVTVSTLGDCKSLQGGTLLATTLLGADGEVYAVAQGSVSLSNFTPGKNAGNTTNKGVLTNGSISSGAIIEKEIDFELSSLDEIKLSLKNPDVTTALQMAKTINNRLSMNIAWAIDPGTVRITIPPEYKHNAIAILAKIEKIEVKPDLPAKIIIDESSGTIVMGEFVKISAVAIAQGNLTLTVAEQKTSAPAVDPFFFNQNIMYADAQNKSSDANKDKKVVALASPATIKEVVNALNSLGVGPRDLINILQNIKAAGALQAEIEVR